MRRPVPKRRPHTLQARLSDLLLGVSGLMLLGALALLVLSWFASDADGIAAVTLPMRDS
jgi:hypothetical protein